MMQIFDPSVIGGVLLILGATALFYGYAQISIMLYFFADTMWVWLSYNNGNIFGTVVIVIGMLLGLGVWIKMNLGIFHKNLKKEKE